jgi:hypothetical protein
MLWFSGTSLARGAFRPLQHNTKLREPMLKPWFRFSVDATMLAVEAHSVIAMRLTSAALGRGSYAENALMVTEKVSAFMEAAAAVAAGGSPHKVVRGYRKHVRANARRLRAR